MQIVLTEGVTEKQVIEKMRSKPKWNWMMWEMEWQRTQDIVDWCVAMSLMSLMQEVM